MHRCWVQKKKYEIDITGIFNLGISRAESYFRSILYLFLKPECSDEYYGEVGSLVQNLKTKKNKIYQFINFRTFIKSHFKNPSLLNKFLMCFEINGLKCLKLTILRFLPRPPTYPYYSNNSKNIFLLKLYLLSINSHKFT